MATFSGHVFATVGTTKFDLFVRTLTTDDVLRELNRKGYRSLTVQCGNGPFFPEDGEQQGIQLHFYRYKDSISEDILNADLVISHAGAGTCLEVCSSRPGLGAFIHTQNKQVRYALQVLECKKKLIVVVNEDLMGNHQIELAEKLSDDGHVFYCTPSNLCHLIQTMNLSQLKHLPPSSASSIAKFIDKVSGVGDLLNS